MGTTYTDKFVLSVGGSLVVPNGGINTQFLKKLNSFIRKQLLTNKNRQFFLTIGGGATTRHYQAAAREVIGHELPDEDLDWLGIHSTRLNAHLVRTVFRDIAHPNIIKDYSIIQKVTESVVVAAGWKPGWSTDYCAALLCQDYGVTTVINLSNIAQVYDKDPKVYSDAKPIENMSWDDMRKLTGDAWVPGMHIPFDPIAAKKAQEIGITVMVTSGDDLDNVEHFIDGEKFVGTVIR